MEYVYSLVVNKIVQDFKGTAITVKADKQVFVFVLPFAAVKPAVILRRIKSPTNVRLAYAVLEGGRIELNVNIHFYTIMLSKRNNKRPESLSLAFHKLALVRAKGGCFSL